MAKSKPKDRRIALQCSECGAQNYHLEKSNEMEGKLELRKYCPTERRHTIHKEVKTLK